MIQKYYSSSKIDFSILLISFVLLILTSCGEESAGQCFDNRTAEPIDLYINGTFEFTIDEDSEDCLFLDDGCYDWYVEGVLSGYYLEGTICFGDESFLSTIVIDD